MEVSLVVAIWGKSFGRAVSVAGSVAWGHTQVRGQIDRSAAFGTWPTTGLPQCEKGPDKPALFEFLCLLPVGLADFMGADAIVENQSGQRDSAKLSHFAKPEKNRAFSRARPVTREEVTIGRTIKARPM
jgi:hypothetical protein